MLSTQKLYSKERELCTKTDCKKISLSRQDECNEAYDSCKKNCQLLSPVVKSAQKSCEKGCINTKNSCNKERISNYNSCNKERSTCLGTANKAYSKNTKNCAPLNKKSTLANSGATIAVPLVGSTAATATLSGIAAVPGVGEVIIVACGVGVGIYALCRLVVNVVNKHRDAVTATTADATVASFDSIGQELARSQSRIEAERAALNRLSWMEKNPKQWRDECNQLNQKIKKTYSKIKNLERYRVPDVTRINILRDQASAILREYDLLKCDKILGGG